MFRLHLTLVLACGFGCSAPLPNLDAGPVIQPADAGSYVAPDGGRPLSWDGGSIDCIEATGACSGTDCLRINESVSNNEGVWLDQALETEDYVELVNIGSEPIDLTKYYLGDKPAKPIRLSGVVAAGQRRLIWLDDELEQGPDHLPFKLSSRGEELILWHHTDGVQDCSSVPGLAANEAFTRIPDGVGVAQRCAFASPEQPNADPCQPPPATPVEPGFEYTPYTWPESWPAQPQSVALSELVLRQDDAFIELRLNEPTSLAGYQLMIAPHQPGEPLPSRDTGVGVPLPLGEQRAPWLVVPVSEAARAALEADPEYEGVVTLFDAQGAAVDRVDFMRLPSGASLARRTDGPWQLCQAASPGRSNADCRVLAERAIGDRLRRLLTPGDFGRLAQGGRALGMSAVKVIVDRENGHVVHFASSQRFDLHYTFVREVIEGQPHLDRCDADERRVFRAGWTEFSAANYQEVEGRRYYSATLVNYSSNGLKTLEFVTGDRISGAQILEVFQRVSSSMLGPRSWSVRPQSPDQHEKVVPIQSQVPLVAQNAPFVGLVQQPLNAAIGYGTMRYIAYQDLPSASLGHQVIVVTDQVPNELALVAGLITESFQTPLAHVNLLARNRGTPNLALKAARLDPRIAPFLGELVRFEVRSDGFSVRAASAEEAEAFWQAQRAEAGALTPRLDETLRGVQPLGRFGIDSLPALGAKAAQLAQLSQLNLSRTTCPGPVTTPDQAFAVPVVHSREHLDASGATARLAELEAEPQFRVDPEYRAQALGVVQRLITEHPVDAALLQEVSGAIQSRWGTRRVRLRSSSNTEDLQGFGGAGLYRSVSVEFGDDERRVDDGLRAVWASLWSARAYDERVWFGVDQTQLGMGVLVHAAFRSEEANGVGISRNVLDPNRGDIHYMNVQAGEASVTNPAPGVTSESFLFRFGRSPEVVYQSRSSLTRGAPVLQTVEIRQAICTLAGIHSAFRPLLDPDREDRYFAMDIEFKLVGEERGLVVKQARPFSFGSLEPVGDCREF